LAKRRLKYLKRQLTSSPLKDQRPFVFFWKQKRKPLFLKVKIVLLAVVVSFCLGASVSYFLQQRTVVTSSPAQVLSIPIHHTQACFTPGQACLPLIQQALAIAQKSIHLQAYTFTRKKMTEDLIQATKTRPSESWGFHCYGCISGL
jgi:phosphatidylserine/phosphatidylglycerophosphate/cardiolipin synthase-like enzyme